MPKNQSVFMRFLKKLRSSFGELVRPWLLRMSNHLTLSIFDSSEGRFVLWRVFYRGRLFRGCNIFPGLKPRATNMPHLQRFIDGEYSQGEIVRVKMFFMSW